MEITKDNHDYLYQDHNSFKMDNPSQARKPKLVFKNLEDRLKELEIKGRIKAIKTTIFFRWITRSRPEDLN